MPIGEIQSQPFDIGPPLGGISDVPQENGVQVVYLDNILPSSGRWETAPVYRDLELNRPCDLGIYVAGVAPFARIFTIGYKHIGDSFHVYYTATHDTRRVEVDLTDFYGEMPLREDPYSFASLARRIYFAGGQRLYEVDLTTLEPIPVTFTAGRESQTVSYIVTPPPVRSVFAFDGRLYLTLSQEVDLETHSTVDPNDPLMGKVRGADPSKLNLDGTIHYTPADFLFTDPYEPDHIQWYSSFNVDDDGSEVTAVVPHMGAIRIITSKGVWSLDGSTPGSWTMVQEQRCGGSRHPGSVQVVGGVLMWTGDNAFWRWDGNGISQVPNTKWLFGGGSSLPSQYIDVAEFVRVLFFWNNASRFSVRAASYLAGKYYVAVCNKDDLSSGLNAAVVIEIATNAISLVSNWSLNSGRQTLCDAESSGILGNGGGLLMGNPTGYTLQYIPAQGGPYGYPYRQIKWVVAVHASSWTRQNLTRLSVRHTSQPVSSTGFVYSVDDVASGGKWDRNTTGGNDAKTLPLVGTEGGIVWGSYTPGATGKWQPSTPADAHSIWYAAAPVTIDYDISALGRQLVIGQDSTFGISARFEQITIQWHQEAAP